MNKIHVTAGLNLAKPKIKWTDVGGHNKRSAKASKNKNIIRKYTPYNYNGSLLDENIGDGSKGSGYYKLMSPYISSDMLRKKHDKYIKNRQKSRAKPFASKRAYLRHIKRRNTRCAVITFGNSAFQKRFERLERKHGNSPLRTRCIERNCLKHYIENFNKRHHRIKIDRYSIQIDEKFVHCHAELVGIAGVGKSGKRSMNFNNALRKEENDRDNRKALKDLRSKEDPLIVRAMGYDVFTLVRTHKATKDDERQHSYAVAQSNKASAYSSRASAYSDSALDVSMSASAVRSKAREINKSLSNAKLLESNVCSYADSFYSSAVPVNVRDSMDYMPETATELAQGSLGTADHKYNLANNYLSHSASSVSASVSASVASASQSVYNDEHRLDTYGVNVLYGIDKAMFPEDDHIYRMAYNQFHYNSGWSFVIRQAGSLTVEQGLTRGNDTLTHIAKNAESVAESAYPTSNNSGYSSDSGSDSGFDIS